MSTVFRPFRRTGKALSILILTATCSAFELPKEAVYPRIFTPNGDGINDVVYFNVVNLSLDGLEGKIFDKMGSPVADLRPAPPLATPSLQPDALMWDGRDRNGNTVRAGVYIYQVRSANKTVTGTVVVAK